MILGDPMIHQMRCCEQVANVSSQRPVAHVVEIDADFIRPDHRIVERLRIVGLGQQRFLVPVF